MKAYGALVLLGACAVPAQVVRATAPLQEPVREAPQITRPGAPLRPATRRTFDDTLERVSRTRGLPVVRPVRCEEVDRTTLLRLVREHVTREVPSSAIVAEGLIHQLLGDFPANGDYEAATYALLERSLAGYYEPNDQTMYLARDLDPATTATTLAHELVHALEDQRWDLRARSAYTAGEDDHDTAFSALAEGDATSASEVLAEAPALGEALDENPAPGSARTLERSLFAPYVVGTRFVASLRRAGGWSLVNDAWMKPPVTTEQVIHPEKWLSHEPAERLTDPPAPGELTQSEATTSGELGVALALAGFMDLRTAVFAASGWGGDRLALYRQGDRAALAWHIRFDDASPRASDAFAIRTYAAMASALAPRGSVVKNGDGELCLERGANGVLAVTRSGRDLVLVVGSVAMTQPMWHPLMTCSDALAWADVTLRASVSADRAESDRGPRTRPAAPSGATDRAPSPVP